MLLLKCSHCWLHFKLFWCIEKVTVICNQTGKVFKVKVEQLSLESGHELTEGHLVKGAQLLLDYKSKTYPVSLMNSVEATKKGNYLALVALISLPNSTFYDHFG